MNGFRAALNKARADRQQAPPKRPAPAPKPGAPPQAEGGPKPEAPWGAVVTHVCGHKTGVANVASRVCGQCMVAARKARRVRKAQRADLVPRLPNGALVMAHYDALTTSWSGTLEVEGQVFEGRASGLFPLLRALDQQYREAKGGAP